MVNSTKVYVQTRLSLSCPPSRNCVHRASRRLKAVLLQTSRLRLDDLVANRISHEGRG
jgi:hypothetical protein